MISPLLVIIPIVVLTTLCASASDWQDASFEALKVGPLVATGKRASGWEVQQSGREVIRHQLAAECLLDAKQAHRGEKCIALSLPKETQGFEFVTLGQRKPLDAGKDYEASVWVRWPDGPDQAPAGASASSGHPSAIVSFWVRHRDGEGDFAGRDEWLFDSHWHQLKVRFRATHPDQPSLVYVSLLPNQKPVATTVLVDDFELTEKAATMVEEVRRGSLSLDADFSKQETESITAPWYFANIGGTGISGKGVTQEAEKFIRLAMAKDTSNFESAQLWQHIALSEGVAYRVSCRIRWDNFTQESPAPIVNFGIYHEASHTWYGPVDQVLEKTGDWRPYHFTHIPPYPGPWKLYVQLNGWGNFEQSVVASFDDFICEPIR